MEGSPGQFRRQHKVRSCARACRQPLRVRERATPPASARASSPRRRRGSSCGPPPPPASPCAAPRPTPPDRSPRAVTRSEEHTSELQSRLHLVCRLLLEKKKKKKTKL